MHTLLIGYEKVAPISVSNCTTSGMELGLFGGIPLTVSMHKEARGSQEKAEVGDNEANFKVQLGLEEVRQIILGRNCC